MSWEVRLGEAGKELPKTSPMLVLTDPPFGTGKTQTQRDNSYVDSADTAYVLRSLQHWGDLLHDDGTMVVICDYRLAFKVVPALDSLVLRGEIIWTFGLGRPRSSWWPNRHNHMLTFTHSETAGLFNKSAIPREFRKAPKKGYPLDKPAGSVWDYTMNNTNPERVGYPNQKPEAILEPFILAHTNPGDLVVDPFCGSSSTGVIAVSHGREYLGIDINPEAIRISNDRFTKDTNDDHKT